MTSERSILQLGISIGRAQVHLERMESICDDVDSMLGWDINRKDNHDNKDSKEASGEENQRQANEVQVSLPLC